MIEYAIYKLNQTDLILHFDRIAFLSFTEYLEYRKNYAFVLIAINPHEPQQLPLFILE